MKFTIKSISNIVISEIDTGEPILLLDLKNKDMSVPIVIDNSQFKKFSINGAVIEIEDILYNCHIKGIVSKEE